MIGILAVIITMALFFGICRLFSSISKGTLDIPCPECNGKLHYHITEEMDKQGLRYVDYTCESCGWKIRLPEEEMK